MSWNRFAYICRRVHRELAPDTSANTLISGIENSPVADQYGPAIRQRSIQRQILDTLAHQQDLPRLKKMLSVYGGLVLSSGLTEPVSFIRKLNYLALVVVVYIYFTLIYRYSILPKLMEPFREMGLPVSNYWLFYENNYLWMLLIILCLLAVILMTGLTLNRMLRLELNPESSSVYRFLVPPFIRKIYQGIRDLLFFPLSTDNADFRGQNQHPLSELALLEMDMTLEIKAILDAQLSKLAKVSGYLMNAYYVLAYIVICITIFFFLISFYLPINLMGRLPYGF